MCFRQRWYTASDELVSLPFVTSGLADMALITYILAELAALRVCVCLYTFVMAPDTADIRFVLRTPALGIGAPPPACHSHCFIIALMQDNNDKP